MATVVLVTIGLDAYSLREGSQTTSKLRKRRHVPLTVHVAEPLVGKDDVGRPVTDSLVRDVQVAGARVTGFRDHGRRTEFEIGVSDFGPGERSRAHTYQLIVHIDAGDAQPLTLARSA